MPKKHVKNPGPPKPGTSSRPEPEDRDPHGLNDHIKIKFYDVLGEPKGTQSPECTWEFSRTFYDFCMGLCYNLLACLLAPCLAGWWGCKFGFVAFENIWCLSPCLKITEVACSTMGRIVRSCARCCIYPPCRSLGHFFILFRKEGINDEEDDNPFYHLPSAPVKKTRIIQTPSRNNKVEPAKKDPAKSDGPSNPQKAQGDVKVIPAVVAVGAIPDKNDDLDYMGDRGNMVNLIKRQMQM